MLTRRLKFTRAEEEFIAAPVFVPRFAHDGGYGPEWYVLRIIQHERDRIGTKLDRGKVEHWQPVEEVERRIGRGSERRTVTDEKPAVSGYLLARFPGPPRWHVVASVAGIIGVIGYGGLPRRIGEEELAQMAQLPESIRARVEADAALVQARRDAERPVAGEGAYITEGAYAGGEPVPVVAVDEATGIATVLIAMFGGERGVRVDAGKLRRAG